MYSKKSIIKYLKGEGFKHQSSIAECLSSHNRSFFVEVISRSKRGWKHIFFNPATGARLEFEEYFMTIKNTKKDTRCVKLNKNNERVIDSIISTFLEI